MNDIEKLYDTIAADVERRLAPKMARAMLGTVTSASGENASVVIDGDESPTPVSVFSQGATAGMRALVLASGTQYYLIGVR